LIGLVDTNLFKKLTKNTNGIHDGFLRTIERESPSITWVVSRFGWLEYLGLTYRGTLDIESMDPGWELPKPAQIQCAKLINFLGLEFSSYMYWVRTKAKSAFAEHLTAEVLEAKASEDQLYHSESFSQGPFANPLFNFPRIDYQASDIVELLSIDYLHRYHDFPTEIASVAWQIYLSTILAEHYVEKRNVVLFRGFKQAWNSRLKGRHEDLVAPATMVRLERAISRLKNDADRFDHDLLAFFLLGYAVDGEYKPVTIYTQDNPDEILCRLAIFQNIVTDTWNALKSLEGVGHVPFQLRARILFITDTGESKYKIGFQELGEFLLNEHLLVRGNRDNGVC
jgi:hypothetical protein